MDAVEFANAPVKRIGMEKVVDFSPENLKAPFFLRCGALFIDYMVVFAAPLTWLLGGKMFGEVSSASSLGSTCWLIAVVLVIANLVVFPLLRGKSLGKALTGLTIVRLDGTPAHISDILRRNVLGYFLTMVTLGLGFLVSAVNGSGRALHDFVGGTIVVSGSRRRKL